MTTLVISNLEMHFPSESMQQVATQLIKDPKSSRIMELAVKVIDLETGELIKDRTHIRDWMGTKNEQKT